MEPESTRVDKKRYGTDFPKLVDYMTLEKSKDFELCIVVRHLSESMGSMDKKF